MPAISEQLLKILPSLGGKHRHPAAQNALQGSLTTDPLLPYTVGIRTAQIVSQWHRRQQYIIMSDS